MTDETNDDDPVGKVQLKLRFTERLRARIEKSAEKNRRSMNAEIVARLEASFQRDDFESIADAAAVLAATLVVGKLSGTK